MLKEVDITFFRGELVRTEIRIIRKPKEFPLKSCGNLSRLFPRTLSVINVLNKTRGNGRDAYDSKSKFIRRYHVCTGDEDKADKKKWISGKSNVEDFAIGKKQLTDDSRTDAYAITGVCLRVANAVDNMYVYSVWSGNKNLRHRTEMTQTIVWNSHVTSSSSSIRSAKLLTKDNFDNVMKNPDWFAAADSPKPSSLRLPNISEFEANQFFTLENAQSIARAFEYTWIGRGSHGGRVV
ncbi:uncharacterized protein VP01_216g3 [Puccinia sorghi]|uniref:Uncharacterized protein n=1 Tax=Puccinia sorghi TaxID=27349 RepID=A0A0L6V9G7_9BASI|nr:uncharacterized protein VP01_216g3 [Puccinia sorghi]